MRNYKFWEKLILIVMLLVIILGNANYSLAYPNTFKDEASYIKATIRKKYLYNFDNNILKSNNFKQIFNELDKHSQYYTKDELDKILQGFNSEIAGIGIYIQKDKENRTYISKIIENSPSDGKMKPGDIIVEIDGISVKDLSLDEVANLIRGKERTVISLRLINLDTNRAIVQNIKREKIKIEALSYKVIEDKIGYLKIELFSKDVDKDFKQALNNFEVNNINKLIIDLRGNGGGYLDETINICRMLISNNPIVHTKSKDYEKTYYSFLVRNKYKKEDLVVLIDGNTASASEILAAAIKDTKSGILVGNTTYGKGTVQKLYSLPSGAGFKLTEAIYLTPNKNIIEGKGIKPDYEVDLSLKIDNQLNLAVELLSN